MAVLETVSITPMVPNYSDRLTGVTWIQKEKGLVIPKVPHIFFDNGEPWLAANAYALAKLESVSGNDIKTVTSNMGHLKAYAGWLEGQGVDWRHFPSKKKDRCLFRYRGFLVTQRDAGLVSPSTATSRMATIIHFYRWAQVYGWIERQPIWADRQKIVQFYDAVGFSRTMSVLSSEPQMARLELLTVIKDEIITRLIAGHSPHSVPHYLSTLMQFFRFLDENQRSFSVENLEDNYLEYAEYLFEKSRNKKSTINEKTAYIKAATLSALFGSILTIPETVRLVNRTRLRSSPTAKKSVNKTVEKQNLEATFKQGHFLVDLVAGLSADAIYGSLPLTIPIRSGLIEQDQVLLSAGLFERDWHSTPKDQWSDNQIKLHRAATRLRRPVSTINGKGGGRRWRLVNLRVQAEFLIFLAQTGMNVAQAKELKRGALKYKPLGDSWQIRCYKNRKGGEVSFRVYKSYKPFLEKYRSFINHFFPDSEFLFPLFDKNGLGESVIRNGLSSLSLVHSVLTNYSIPWTTPRELRNTRVNWLLRRSGDLDLTAEMAQHTREVLMQQYERPSQQRAMIEITQFWNKHDPIQQGDLSGSIISGICNGMPQATDDKPTIVVEPNCVNPSGCLWCRHHRDSDTEDYVWSLVSMRHLKSIEASMNITRESVPADRVLERLTAKLAWFKSASPQRAQWVDESLLRVEEGDYHPNWSAIIEFLE